MSSAGRLAVFTLGAALLTSSPARLLSVEAPVLVHFGGLALVYAKDGLPRLDASGTLLVPVATTCALVGATCERKSLTLRATLGDVSVQLPVTDEAGNAFVPLRRFTNGLGLGVAWQPSLHGAVVSDAANRGDLASIADYDVGSAVSPVGRLWARFEPKANSRLLDLTVRAERGLLTIESVFSKLSTGALAVTGAAALGTPDNPSVKFACARSGSSCTVTIDRDASYALVRTRRTEAP
ncbi:hypothetical protein [Deinococcus yavapaiensis]|uniref:Uncharacterized protein n=1 Tax=Deinococcus yavapaiensis KR-236 TaxID=694435 RepID=A0A318S8Z2_9DEIO|nr:hypothetical protein [Deinococcus yavapaiensis]PYE55671.1 hypothetical protein DES52_10234 [Deinococcus yavapaiensis KR-236]